MQMILLARSEAELQSLLFSLESWCKYWQLNVKISKTEIIHFLDLTSQIPLKIIFSSENNLRE